ncbi:MAG: T9SS type A sorting domain-containing protein, partial [Saprospiraceae bacterium]|nr:T9SS type A sorting domain-containing protein [Saprospiraceae bacterium]
GNLEWQKTLGGNSLDSATEICITSDGGYVVFGVGSSNNGDMTGHQGGYDYWVVKLDAAGNLEWQKSFGGSGEDWGKSIKQTNDGGYILFGSSQSNDGDVVGNHGGQDSWLLKLDSAGELIWQRALGGTKAEVGSYVQQTHDGGFILTGRSQSNDGDASFNRGSSDYWVVKLSPETTSSTLSPFAHNPLELYPNPASQSITVQIPGDLDETRLSVRITDLLGMEILQRTCNNGESLDLAQLPNGMFLLSATSASGKVFFGKFRKQE